jgi:hypothetical protein
MYYYLPMYVLKIIHVMDINITIHLLMFVITVVLMGDVIHAVLDTIVLLVLLQMVLSNFYKDIIAEQAVTLDIFNI